MSFRTFFSYLTDMTQTVIEGLTGPEFPKKTTKIFL